MATVLELTPGDPGSFLHPPPPHPACSQTVSVLSVCSARGGCSEALAPRPSHPAGLWGAGARSSPPQPIQPTSVEGVGGAAPGPRQAGPSPPSPPLPAAPLQAEKWGKNGGGRGRKGRCPRPLATAGALRGPGGAPHVGSGGFSRGLPSGGSPLGPHTHHTVMKASPAPAAWLRDRIWGPGKRLGLCPKPTQEGSGAGRTQKQRGPPYPPLPVPHPPWGSNRRVAHPATLKLPGLLRRARPSPSG